MKKLITFSIFITLSLVAGYRIYAGSGDSFAGGMAGGMFGGLIGGSIASSANRGSSSDNGASRRALDSVYDEIDRLREAVRKDLEGLNDKLDGIWKEVKKIKRQLKKRDKVRSKPPADV